MANCGPHCKLVHCGYLRDCSMILFGNDEMICYEFLCEHRNRLKPVGPTRSFFTKAPARTTFAGRRESHIRLPSVSSTHPTMSVLQTYGSPIPRASLVGRCFWKDIGPRGSRVDLVSTNSEHSERCARKNNAEVYFFGSKNIEGPEDETRIEELQSDEGDDLPSVLLCRQWRK